MIIFLIYKSAFLKKKKALLFIILIPYFFIYILFDNTLVVLYNKPIIKSINKYFLFNFTAY